jgi:hypothetical protein
MAYELMDVRTGNLIGYYPTVQAALEAVAETVRLYGLGAAASLALGDEDVDGPEGIVAQGTELARRALQASSVRQVWISNIPGMRTYAVPASSGESVRVPAAVG